jgi:hypothetical protein
VTLSLARGRCQGRYGLLVVDEVGYLPLERQAANLLFALVSRRYERGSIIVTSNRALEAWGEILGDAMVAATLIDRLVHHATMVTLKGKSHRLRERGTNPTRRPRPNAPGAQSQQNSEALPNRPRRLRRLAHSRDEDQQAADPLAHSSLPETGALFGSR